MNNYKTIETINKFDNIAKSGPSCSEDKLFIEYFCLHLAESIFNDFGETQANSLAKTIIAVLGDATNNNCQ